MAFFALAGLVLTLVADFFLADFGVTAAGETFFCALLIAHRFRWASAIRFRASGLIARRVAVPVLP